MSEQPLHAPQALIELALKNCVLARMDYVDAAQSDREEDPALLRRFHASVINFYLALRPYRTERAIATRWTEARMWDGETGVDILGGWIARKGETTVSRPGHGARQQTQRVAQQLDAQRLIRASTILEDLALALGIGIQVRPGRRPAGMVGEDDFELDEETDAIDVESES